MRWTNLFARVRLFLIISDYVPGLKAEYLRSWQQWRGGCQTEKITFSAKTVYKRKALYDLFSLRIDLNMRGKKFPITRVLPKNDHGNLRNF